MLIANKDHIKIGSVNKVVSNLGNKDKYLINYKNIQVYLSLEIKLVSVHRILKCKQLIG